MIDKLQRNFILISAASVFASISLVFVIFFVLNLSAMNRNMDLLADKVSEGGGKFPGEFDEPPFPDKAPPGSSPSFDFITPETPFSTRHFTIFFNNDGNVQQTFTESIYLFLCKCR